MTRLGFPALVLLAAFGMGTAAFAQGNPQSAPGNASGRAAPHFDGPTGAGQEVQPVHEGVAVTQLAPSPDGGYTLTTNAGDIAADQVVLAVGGYHLPVVPPYATALPAVASPGTSPPASRSVP